MLLTHEPFTNQGLVSSDLPVPKSSYIKYISLTAFILPCFLEIVKCGMWIWHCGDLPMRNSLRRIRNNSKTENSQIWDSWIFYGNITRQISSSRLCEDTYCLFSSFLLLCTSVPPFFREKVIDLSVSCLKLKQNFCKLKPKFNFQETVFQCQK